MPRKVLVVDDDDSFLEFLCLRLRTSGYKVLAAREGLEAVRIAKSAKPDVIVLDIMMPQMHGYAVCRAIREDEALADMKIIIISAKGYKTDMTSAKALGADHYLVKPFDTKELLALIRLTTGEDELDR